MQYSPEQQPPAHSPSEIYMPEQPQAYPPQPQVYAPQYQPPMQGQEITRPPMQVQEIVIYPNRKQAIMRTTLVAVCLVFLIVMLVGILAFGFITGGPLQASDIAPLLVVLAIMFSAIAFVGWMTWGMAQLVLKPTPLLIINRQGITVGKMTMLSGFFIPWHEIEAIHTSTFMYKYLCIRPRDSKQFLKRFNILERFNRLSNSMVGVPPLIVPQVFLERPVEEILQQLYYMYANELNYYHVQLRP